jgi:rod shape-determining protein MreD
VRAVRGAPVLVGILVLQASLFAQLPLFGVRADVVVLAVVAAALAGGAEPGAVAGFTAGLAFDLVHAEPWPLGLSALAYCLTGFLVGRLTGDGSGPPLTRVQRALVAAAGSAAGLVLLAAIGRLLDHRGTLDGRLVVVATVVGSVNALLIGPALRLARWVLATPARRSPVDGRLVS